MHVPVTHRFPVQRTSHSGHWQLQLGVPLHTVRSVSRTHAVVSVSVVVLGLHVPPPQEYVVTLRVREPLSEHVAA